MGSKANNRTVWDRTSAFTVMLTNAIYNGARRNTATAAHMHNQEVRNGVRCSREEEINQGTGV